MGKSINILDKDYIQWIKELSNHYRKSQIKAAVKVGNLSTSCVHFVPKLEISTIKKLWRS